MQFLTLKVFLIVFQASYHITTTFCTSLSRNWFISAHRVKLENRYRDQQYYQGEKKVLQRRLTSTPFAIAKISHRNLHMKSVLSSFATISIHIALELEKYLYSYESTSCNVFMEIPKQKLVLCKDYTNIGSFGILQHNMIETKIPDVDFQPLKLPSKSVQFALFGWVQCMEEEVELEV